MGTVQALLLRIKQFGRDDPVVLDGKPAPHKGERHEKERPSSSDSSASNSQTDTVNDAQASPVSENIVLAHAGLGRKSIACIILLCLGKKEFPVDVNVGRISARLGWIPLDAEQALELVRSIREKCYFGKDMTRASYQLWYFAGARPLQSNRLSIYICRLMRFPVEMLYELHYQMITLGKASAGLDMPTPVNALPLTTAQHQGGCQWITAPSLTHAYPPACCMQVLCTKRSPNCMSCPLRSACEYAQNNGRCLKAPPTAPQPPADAASSSQHTDMEDAAKPPAATSNPAASQQPAAAAAAQPAALVPLSHLPALQEQSQEVERIAACNQELAQQHEAHSAAAAASVHKPMPDRWLAPLRNLHVRPSQKVSLNTCAPAAKYASAHSSPTSHWALMDQHVPAAGIWPSDPAAAVYVVSLPSQEHALARKPQPQKHIWTAAALQHWAGCDGHASLQIEGPLQWSAGVFESCLCWCIQTSVATRLPHQ
ncbi:hypothetical protein MMC29_003003 [Sticta canariensis]|nr:hypothetical protein [Sticta canariensis]